ncbi:MFS transporter [Gordonia phthalatica]|uniref:MFS transporter n=1 Tax=Gordonia phthalatica TaxID=1136941 RepID=A0A0N9NBL3_9ACTN|nr:MFS transporter [Gordonia phthalatica]ALG84409.1 MFS transporter [Gordonia phthalatica]
MTSPASDRALPPLFLAGFTTAFGAHGVAAVLGSESSDIGLSILGLGLILALYDVAEVIFKPVFGSLSDRIGTKPVIVGGLVAFVLASCVAVVHPTPLLFAVARLGQGIAASAFSPASSASVARLAGPKQLGRYFGRYGAWKSVGYVLGPLIGVAIAHWWSIAAVFGTMAAVGAIAAVWVVVGMPALPVVPRPRYTVADLIRQTTDRGFLVPTMILATSTGVLGVAVGFLPYLATQLDLPALVGPAAVAVLALGSIFAQPRVGALHDAGRLAARRGSTVGLAVAAACVVLIAVAPHAATLFIAAAGLGIAIGTVTPLAFSHLASVTPEERMGRTMGNAEMGRELGDAGGPLLVGGVAAVAALPVGLGVLGGVTAVSALLAWAGLRDRARDQAPPN